MNEISIVALGDLQESIIADWLGPIFFIAIAVFAIIFIKDRSWMKLVGFVGVAAIVGVLIFGSDNLFGDNGIFSQAANNAASDLDAGGGGGGGGRTGG